MKEWMYTIKLPALKKHTPTHCSYHIEAHPISGRPSLPLPYSSAYKALAHLLPLSEGLPVVWELGEAFGTLIGEFPSPDGWGWATAYHCLTTFICVHASPPAWGVCGEGW